MNGSPSALAGALSLAALATPAMASPAPGRSEIRDALDHDLNTRCGGALESDNCTSHPSSVAVRHVSCAMEGEATALCRYERRIQTIGAGAARWRRAVTRFRRDDRAVWKAGLDFTLKPDASDVESALVWESGRPCRNLIDACIDDEGNSLFQEPEYSVSRLHCRPLADQRSDCSFKSVESNSGRRAPRRSCQGILISYEDGVGRQGWTFALDPKRHHAPILQCN
jgi:hypothetical protein